MRLNSKHYGLLLGSAALAAASAVWAQQQPPQKIEDTGATFRSDTRVVVCHATVVDKSGHLVTDLPKTAFTVYENGVQQPITKFNREDVPVSIGLIIDNSGSMRDKRKKVESAAADLVLASNKEDESFVVNFNDAAWLDLPGEKDFTSNIDELKEALARIDSRGGTAMRDALKVSIEHLKEKAHKDKKVLVVVTDGVDNSSIISLEALVREAQQTGVIIYAVGLLAEEDRKDAKKAQHEIQALVDATGGEAFFPKEASEVDRYAQQVARDIRSQYTIQYTPTDTAMDGKFRAIKITARAPGNPTVRTRNGYYATPDQSAPKGSTSFK
jgi:VWFA-related protein